jgi:hypothetical protein
MPVRKKTITRIDIPTVMEKGPRDKIDLIRFIIAATPKGGFRFRVSGPFQSLGAALLKPETRNLTPFLSAMSYGAYPPQAGCPVMNIKAALPFHGMMFNRQVVWRRGLCGL